MKCEKIMKKCVKIDHTCYWITTKYTLCKETRYDCTELYNLRISIQSMILCYW